MRIWDLSRHPTPNPVTIVEQSKVAAVAVDSRARQLAIADSKGQIALFVNHASGWQRTTVLEYEGRLKQVAFSPDDKWLAVVSSNIFSSDLRLWALSESFLGSAAEPLSLKGHPSELSACVFGPNSRVLATGDDNGKLLLWRYPFNKEPQRLQVPVPDAVGRVALIAFSSNGRWLLTAWSGGEHGSAGALWDLASKDPVEMPGLFADLGERITAAAFNPSGSYLATAGEGGRVRVWGLAEDRLATEALVLPDHAGGQRVRLIAWSDDGKWLTRFGSNGDVVQWNLDLAEIVERACRVAGRNLSSAEWRGFFPNEEYRKTCIDVPIHPSLLMEGRNLIRSGFLARATRTLERALELDPYLDIDPEEEIQLALASRAVDEGRALARSGRREEAEASFRRAMELDPSREIDPDELAKSLMAESKFWQARQLAAQGGDLEKVITLIEESLDARGEPWPENFLDNEGWSRVARSLHNSGHDFAKRGQPESAITAFRAAELMDPRVPMLAEAWNDICWWGSLWGRAGDVLGHCEHLVQLGKDHGGNRDSRGVARALTGNHVGAIEDFEFFVEWASSNENIGEEVVRQREIWIAELVKGNQPLTSDVLERIREASKGVN